MPAKTIQVENFTRLAREPEMIATVITAKVSWNPMSMTFA